MNLLLYTFPCVGGQVGSQQLQWHLMGYWCAQLLRTRRWRCLMFSTLVSLVQVCHGLNIWCALPPIDMINMLRLGYVPLACVWLYAGGAATAALAWWAVAFSMSTVRWLCFVQLWTGDPSSTCVWRSWRQLRAGSTGLLTFFSSHFYWSKCSSVVRRCVVSYALHSTTVSLMQWCQVTRRACWSTGVVHPQTTLSPSACSSSISWILTSTSLSRWCVPFLCVVIYTCIYLLLLPVQHKATPLRLTFSPSGKVFAVMASDRKACTCSSISCSQHSYWINIYTGQTVSLPDRETVLDLRWESSAVQWLTAGQEQESVSALKQLSVLCRKILNYLIWNSVADYPLKRK